MNIFDCYPIGTHFKKFSHDRCQRFINCQIAIFNHITKWNLTAIPFSF